MPRSLGGYVFARARSLGVTKKSLLSEPARNTSGSNGQIFLCFGKIPNFRKAVFTTCPSQSWKQGHFWRVCRSDFFLAWLLFPDSRAIHMDSAKIPKKWVQTENSGHLTTDATIGGGGPLTVACVPMKSCRTPKGPGRSSQETFNPWNFWTLHSTLVPK